MVSETTDYIFSESPFLIKGFSTPYRLDWTAKDEEMFYIREEILKKSGGIIKEFFVEINLRC